MPIRIQNDLPAKAILEKENIFVMDEHRAMHQDIRPIAIAILNLMPLKEDTELQLLRSLSNTPLQVNVTFLAVASHEVKNTSKRHMHQFYDTFDNIKNKNFDGLIITGAPVELYEYEDVDYWDEFCKIAEWSKTHVTSTLYLCWGAQAGLYYHYGIQKHILKDKVFGIYSHKVMHRKVPLVRGFDDYFMAPHSRYTEVNSADIKKNKNLITLADSKDVGVFLCMSNDGKQIFCMGHPEYDRLTLDTEYKRDLKKGLEITKPVNYYPNDDENLKPMLQWRGHANTFYTNWLNYYVYQNTPFMFLGPEDLQKYEQQEFEAAQRESK